MGILRTYLDKNEIQIIDFAKSLGCHRMTIQKWLSGDTRPGIRLAKKIQNLTNGAVTLKDFYPEFFVK